MHVVGRQKIDAAIKAHPEWRASLVGWIAIAENHQWRRFEDVKNSVASASRVGKYVVFNIAHGRCRLKTKINYPALVVDVEKVMTHAEYDREDFSQ